MIKVSNLVHSYLKYGKTEEDTISVKALDHVDMEIDKGLSLIHISEPTRRS